MLKYEHLSPLARKLCVREVDIKVYNPRKMIIISFSPIKHIFWCVKEKSLRDISFMHPTHIFL